MSIVSLFDIYESDCGRAICARVRVQTRVHKSPVHSHSHHRVVKVLPDAALDWMTYTHMIHTYTHVHAHVQSCADRPISLRATERTHMNDAIYVDVRYKQ